MAIWFWGEGKKQPGQPFYEQYLTMEKKLFIIWPTVKELLQKKHQSYTTEFKKTGNMERSLSELKWKVNEISGSHRDHA